MQNTTIRKILTLIVILSAALILVFTDYSSNNPVVYDCGMAEWHPDIPAKVKEECRKLRKSVST